MLRTLNYVLSACVFIACEHENSHGYRLHCVTILCYDFLAFSMFPNIFLAEAKMCNHLTKSVVSSNGFNIHASLSDQTRVACCFRWNEFVLGWSRIGWFRSKTSVHCEKTNSKSDVPERPPRVAFSTCVFEEPRGARHSVHNLRSGRGVTRLDGARGKKQVWLPHVRIWVFFGSKFTVLKRVLVKSLGLFGAPSSHLTPPQWFGARGIVPPLPPLVTPLRTDAPPPVRLSGSKRMSETVITEIRVLHRGKSIFTRLRFNFFRNA